MKPTVGRIVHYHWQATELVPLAAIVTQVLDDMSVTLCVFGWNGLPSPHRLVQYADPPKAGCWSWPPREPAQLSSVEERRQRDGRRGLELPEPTTAEEAAEILEEMVACLAAAQSTDDPSFSPVCDALSARFYALKKKWPPQGG